ncbi:MAG: tetratricopeptide repeat protein [Candidatus Sericytochromatia bacterium]
MAGLARPAPLAWLQQALKALQARQYAQAEALLTPQLPHPAAWHLLGLLALEQGQPESARRAFESALAHGAPPDRQAELHLHLGRLASESQDFQRAVAHFLWAERLGSLDDASAHRLALALHESGQPAPALARYEDLLTRHPQHGALWMQTGNALLDLKRTEAALAAYLRSRACAPEEPLLAFNLARGLDQAGRYAEALHELGPCLKKMPQFAPAWGLQGSLLRQLQRPEEGVAALQRACELAPDNAWNWHNLALGHQALYQAEAAQAAFERALLLAPDALEIQTHLAQLQREQGEADDAHQTLGRLARQNPLLRYQQALLLPPVYTCAEELQTWRQRLQHSLDELEADPPPLHDPLHELGRLLYYLPYQGGDDLPLQQQWARILHKACPSLSWEAPAPKPGRRLRIGLVSSAFYQHTVLTLFGHLAPALAAHAEVWAFAASPQSDPATAHFEQQVSQLVQLPQQLEAARACLASAACDVLLYLDVGMHPLTYLLAFSRLAPVQALTWGHGITSGIPQLDFFLSATDLELPDGQRHYSERLLRLPHLLGQACPPAVPRRSHTDWGLPSGTLYLCPQSLYKLHPDFDAVLAALLAADPQGQLVLIEGLYPQWRQRLEQRWEGQLDLSRVHWLPRLSQADFLALLASGSVMLDPLHFGGGLTLFQALAQNVPVVSWPGKQLKNRLGYGILRQIAWEEGLVTDRESYVRTAVRLAQSGPLPLREALLDSQAALPDLGRLILEALGVGE